MNSSSTGPVYLTDVVHLHSLTGSSLNMVNIRASVIGMSAMIHIGVVNNGGMMDDIGYSGSWSTVAVHLRMRKITVFYESPI